MTLADTCIEWPGKRDKDGYGCLWLAGERCAHRALYRLYCGAIPAGMQVRHTCDNPPCVNPKHLVLGTIADNMKDRTAGRHAIGAEAPNARLSMEMVRHIRGGMNVHSAWANFGISKSAYYRVRAGESYAVTGK